MFNPAITIPNNKAWEQTNRGDLFGSLYSSRNLDPTDPGVMKLSKRMRYVGRQTSGGGNTFQDTLSIVFGTFGATTAGGASTASYCVASASGIFVLDEDLGTFAVMNNGSTPSLTINSDAVAWDGKFMVTNNTDLSSLTAGTWASGLMTLTSGTPHPMAVSSINNYLLVGNGNVLHQRTTAPANSTPVTIPSNFQIEWIRSENKRTYIGTRALDNTHARVFEWDESASAATNSYPVDASWILSGAFVNSDFFILTNDGRIMRFNGGGFEKVAEFPIYESLDGLWNANFSKANCVQRGMRSIDGRLHLNVSGQVLVGEATERYYTNQASGIWTYEQEYGLTHKHGLSNSAAATDFLQHRVLRSGAILEVYQDPVGGSSIDPTVGGTLLAGCFMEDYPTAATDYFVLCSVTDGVNRGSLETTRVETPIIANSSKKIWAKFRGVDTGDDSMLFKYRYERDTNLPFYTTGNSTFTSTTAFTTTDTAWDNASVGDEITVLGGNGSGCTAHITAIDKDTPSGGTDTITLDEAIVNVSADDICRMICDNWIKLDTSITSSDTKGYKDIPIDQPKQGKWAQVKVVLRGNSTITIEDLLFVNADNIPADS